MKKTKQKAKPKPKHAGVMRNDLEGFMRVIGNKIYVRWKGKDFRTGQDNTVAGWKLANEFWAKKLKELKAIDAGEKPAGDTIKNVFEKFLQYKIKYQKIAYKTIWFYKTGVNAVFKEQDKLLTEKEIRTQIQNFIENTNISDTTINIYLNATNGFLNWASDEEQNYIPPKKYIKKYKRKVSVKPKEAYSRQEYEQLLSYFMTDNKNTEIYLLLQFLWLTGARCGETSTINLSDLDLQNNRIFVPNKIFKGEGESLLLIPDAVKIVEKAKELAIERGDTKLFSWKQARLPNLIIGRAEKKLGIKIEGRSLHGFRRTLPARLFAMGMTIPDVQKIMRHRDIRITMKHYDQFEQQILIDKMTDLK